MNYNIVLPQAVNDCINRLNLCGFEAYVVGGAVRDCLLNRQSSDYDITTSALPSQILSCFNDCKTIEVGIKHGTVLVLFCGYSIEITTYRIDGKYSDCRHPDYVSFTAKLSDDLQRRDFTINAFAFNRTDGLIDLFNGQNDLLCERISVIGDGVLRFSEDALRIMRAFRFSAQLGFSIDEKTTKAIKLTAHLLESISSERITAEMTKLLLCENPIPSLKLMKQLGIDQYVIPKMVIPTEFPKKANLSVMLALIIDDISQLARLRLDKNTYNQVKTLLNYKSVTLTPDRSTVKLLLSRLSQQDFFAVINLQNNPENFKQIYDEVIAKGECYKLSMLAVDGNDMIEYGLIGEQIKRALDKLLNCVINDECENEKKQLMDMMNKITL